MNNFKQNRPQITPNPIWQSHYESWRERFANLTVDWGALHYKISKCTVSSCHGMCCYDGVYIENDLKETFDNLLNNKKKALEELGVDLSRGGIVEGEWKGQKGGWKTATAPFPFSALVEDYPAHFDQTACVFHLEDGRCALQSLSLNEGRHPWDYKPPSCWLHPLALTEATLTLWNEAEDPYNLPEYPGYASQTKCGQTSACGAPAQAVLSEELEYLSFILGRNLLAEAP